MTEVLSPKPVLCKTRAPSRGQILRSLFQEICLHYSHIRDRDTSKPGGISFLRDLSISVNMQTMQNRKCSRLQLKVSSSITLIRDASVTTSAALMLEDVKYTFTHPQLQENYTGVKTTRLWNYSFLLFLAKTKREQLLLGQVWSHECSNLYPKIVKNLHSLYEKRRIIPETRCFNPSIVFL